jgi:large conductance mechanosensitive channel
MADIQAAGNLSLLLARLGYSTPDCGAAFILRRNIMSLIKEFRDFAMKGNVVDMAVGIIIGAAFGKIVSSLVADVIMPPIGALLGGINFSHLSITIKAAVGAAPAVTLNYGLFIQTVVDFLIVAFCIFMLVKAMNKLKRKEQEAPAPAPAKPSTEAALLGEIRDILKAQK